MAKYKCKVCGYIHEGNKAPDVCPICAAPASDFEEVKDEAAAAKKGINRDSNVYTVVYAAVMVVLVAVVLAFTSQSLRSFQQKNEENDKRQQILRSINVSVSANEAEPKYTELIKEAFLVNENGEKVEGDAFAADVVKAAAEHEYPVFVANVDGQPKYIMALHGAVCGDRCGDTSLSTVIKTPSMVRTSATRVKLRVWALKFQSLHSAMNSRERSCSWMARLSLSLLLNLAKVLPVRIMWTVFPVVQSQARVLMQCCSTV